MLLKVNDMVEIDCGGIVTSLAFGSSKSFVIHSRKLHRPNVYTRFNYDENMLILAVGLQSGKIRIYDVLKNKFLFILFDHTDFVSEMKFTRDGSFLLASVSKDQTIKLWNMMDDGNMYKSLKAHTSLVCSVDWSPTASLLCSVGSGRQAFIWDTEKYSIKHTLKGHLHDVSTCQFSPDGSVLATGSYDTKIFLWNPYNGNLIKQFFHLIPPPSLIYAGGYNGAYVKGLTFSSHGDHLVSLCDDKKIRIWSMIAKSCNLIAEGVHKDGKVIAYSSESRKIIVGTKNGHLEVYETMVIIPRLVDICRKIVNQFIDRNSIEKLYLPSELKSFLQYENITD
jgi:WD repeat/SOCS box-containing protein 1